MSSLVPNGPESSSHMMKTTKAGRPFHKGTLELFGILMISLQLSTHKLHFRSYPNSFTVDEAVQNLKSVRFSQCNRGSDPGDALRIMTTTRTFTFSMTPEMARAILQHFIDARLIENAADTQASMLKERGVYVISPKGLHVLERFTTKNGVEYPQLPQLLEVQPICVQLIQLQRKLDDDNILFSKQVIKALFRRFAGARPNYVSKSSSQHDGFQKLHERSKGIYLRDHSSLPGWGRKKVQFCFTAVSALEWLCDFTSVVGREEAAEIAAQFSRFNLITLVSEDERDENAVVFSVRGSGSGSDSDTRGDFVCSAAAIYAISEEGRLLANWDTPLLSNVSDTRNKSSLSLATDSTKVDGTSSPEMNDGVSERRSIKESNARRLRYILEKPMLRCLFRDFLKASYCEENLSFWLDVGDFKRRFAVTSSVLVASADSSPSSSPSSTPSGKSHGQLAMEKHHEYLVRLSFHIYNNYLAPSCPAELSIDSRLRSEVVKFLDDVLANFSAADSKPFQAQLDHEHKKAFDTSQLQKLIYQYENIQASVFKTMALDSVPKFIETQTYIAAHTQLDLEDSGHDIKFLTPSDEVPNKSDDFDGIHISVSQLAGESKAGKLKLV